MRLCGSAGYRSLRGNPATRTPPPGAAQVHLLQATGLLWTARRAAGRAMNRLPAEPTWDTSGMRMELAR